MPVSVDQTTEDRYTISAMQIQLNDYNVLLRDEAKVHTDLKSVKYSFSALRNNKGSSSHQSYESPHCPNCMQVPKAFTIYYRPGLINIVPLTENGQVEPDRSGCWIFGAVGQNA